MNQRKRRGCDDSQSNILTSSTLTFSPLLVFSIRKGLLIEQEIINPFQDIVEGIRASSPVDAGGLLQSWHSA